MSASLCMSRSNIQYWTSKRKKQRNSRCERKWVSSYQWWWTTLSCRDTMSALVVVGECGELRMKWAATQKVFSFRTTRSFRFVKRELTEPSTDELTVFINFSPLSPTDNRPCLNHSGGHFHPLPNDLLICCVAYLYSSHLSRLISSVVVLLSSTVSSRLSIKLKASRNYGKKVFSQFLYSPPSQNWTKGSVRPEELLESAKWGDSLNDIQGVEHHQRTNERTTTKKWK